jgi:drug/metabolite transporter (DMT)-like permease
LIDWIIFLSLNPYNHVPIDLTDRHPVQAENSEQENRLGRCLMVLAMGTFAIEDSVIKMLSSTLPVGQILILLGLFGAFIFVLLALIFNKRIWTSDILTLPMHLRVMCEIFGRIFYSTALAFTSLASSTMILQATPLVVVVGASVIFKEKVGVLRWIAVVTGLFGVFIIIQPTAGSFSILSILAILGMLGFAGRDLASRAVPKSINVLTLGVHGFLSIALAGVFLAVYFDEPFIYPDPNTIWLLLLGSILGAVGYSSIISAMRIGEVSAITPFRYSRILFGLLLGVFVFGETLSALQLVGVVLIIASSFAVVHTKPRKSSQTETKPPAKPSR